MVCFTRLCEVSHDHCAFRILRLHPLGGFAKTNRARFHILSMPPKCACVFEFVAFWIFVSSKSCPTSRCQFCCQMLFISSWKHESWIRYMRFDVFKPFRPLVLESGSEAIAGFSRKPGGSLKAMNLLKFRHVSQVDVENHGVGAKQEPRVALRL